MTDIWRPGMQPTQRLLKSVSATSDSLGGATFSMPGAEQGSVYEGTIQIPGAPAGALFVASILGTSWGQFAGPTNFGPIQQWGGEVLSVVATGLTPATQYTMTLTGISKAEAITSPIPPAAPLSVVSVETATLLISNKNMVASVTVATIKPPSLTRRVTVIIDSTNVTQAGQVAVVGNQTNVIYGSAIVKPGVFQTVPCFFAVEPSVDQTYSLQFTGGLGSLQLWVLASFSNPLVETNPASPLVVTGSSLSGTLPFPITGNPTTSPFKTAFSLNAATGANQQLIAAPGAGLAIYLQSLSYSIRGGAGTDIAECHAAGGVFFSSFTDSAANKSLQATFPGGFELPTNTALQVDVTTGVTIRVAGTYVVGASL